MADGNMEIGIFKLPKASSPSDYRDEQAPSKKFATVIPENASTNIRVVLEQSTDLINWTTAAPGVFPPSTAKRFFRVRSEEE